MKLTSRSSSSIEVLEPRIAPAAIIDIVTKNGSATIKVLGNTDTIENLSISGSLNGTLTISGLNGETFRVNGLAGNGPIILPEIVGSLSVDLGKNDDTLTIGNLSLGGALSIRMGDGIGLTTITNLTAGSITYLGGKGNDTVNIQGSTFDIAGKATFTPGLGTNGVTIVADIVRIGGDVLYTGGVGNDFLNFQNNNMGTLAIIGGNLSFKGSLGSNLFGLDYNTAVVGKNVTYTSAKNPTALAGGMFISGTELVRIGGSVSYTNPSGNQSIVIRCDTITEIAGAITIKANPSQDVMALLGNGDFLSAAKISVLGSGGNLSATIGSTVMAVSGAVTLTGLEGVQFGTSGAISGALTIGVGNNGLLFGAPSGDGGLTVSGKTTIKVSSTNNVSTTIANVRFLSSFTATLGRGVDTFLGDSMTVFGAFTLKALAGADAIQLETNAVTGASTFYGPVAISLGIGVDILTVGNGNANDRVFAYRAFKVTDAVGEVLSLLNGNVYLVDPVVI